MNPNPLCSIVISLLNEEENLLLLYQRLSEETAKESEVEWEFVFVDDGSTDRSYEMLKELHERDKRVKAVRLSRNFGAHEGTAASIHYAGGDAAILMSADLQDPPEMIGRFVAKWKEGYDIVWGVRASRKDPLVKKILSYFFYRVVTRFSKFRHPAKGSGSFLLMSRPVIDVYNRLRERNRATFELIAWMGFRQAEVPYNRPERHAGHSKFNFTRQVKTALDGLFSMTQIPIRAITYFGLLVAIVSFIWSSVIVVYWLFFGTQIVGWASTIVSVQFLGGAILVSIGVIGEYAWRILDESRSRPLYIVMETLGDFVPDPASDSMRPKDGQPRTDVPS